MTEQRRYVHIRENIEQYTGLSKHSQNINPRIFSVDYKSVVSWFSMISDNTYHGLQPMLITFSYSFLVLDLISFPYIFVPACVPGSL